MTAVPTHMLFAFDLLDVAKRDDEALVCRLCQQVVVPFPDVLAADTSRHVQKVLDHVCFQGQAHAR